MKVNKILSWVKGMLVCLMTWGWQCHLELILCIQLVKSIRASQHSALSSEHSHKHQLHLHSVILNSHQKSLLETIKKFCWVGSHVQTPSYCIGEDDKLRVDVLYSVLGVFCSYIWKIKWVGWINPVLWGLMRAIINFMAHGTRRFNAVFASALQ